MKNSGNVVLVLGCVQKDAGEINKSIETLQKGAEEALKSAGNV